MSQNVLVVHGGGPTAVINASLYGVIEEAKRNQEVGKVYGAIGGTGAIFSAIARTSANSSGFAYNE